MPKPAAFAPDEVSGQPLAPEQIEQLLHELEALYVRRGITSEEAHQIWATIASSCHYQLAHRQGPFFDAVTGNPQAVSRPSAPVLANQGEASAADPGPVEDAGIITTDTERFIFDYARSRLAFLVTDEELFRRLGDLAWVDRRTLFTVFYKQSRKGRLFHFREGKHPTYRFEFPDLGTRVATDDLKDIDEPLLTIFRRRVEEMG